MTKLLIKEISSCRQCNYTTSNTGIKKCVMFGHCITKAVKADVISKKCKLEDAKKSTKE